MKKRRIWGVIWVPTLMWVNINLTRSIKHNVDTIPNPLWVNIMLWLVVILGWAWFAANLLLAILDELNDNTTEE